MKHSIMTQNKLILTLLAALLMLGAGRSMAYETKYNNQVFYSGYSMGGGAVHVQMPLVDRGAGDGRYACFDLAQSDQQTPKYAYTDSEKASYVYFTVDEDETPTKHKILYYGGFDHARGTSGYGESEIGKDYGNGDMYVTKLAGPQDSTGSYTVTNAMRTKAYSNISWNTASQKYTVGANGFVQHLAATNMSNLAPEQDIEFDWHMPAWLAGKHIHLYVHAAWWQRSGNGNTYIGAQEMQLGSYTITSEQAPSLTQATLFPYDYNNNSAVCNVAVVYTCFQQPVSYRYKLDAFQSGLMNLSQYGGLIIVPAADSTRHMSADFTTVFQLNADVTQTFQGITTTILPLHTIHNFSVSPYTDDEGKSEGYNILRWEIHHADQADLMGSDIFMIQRATKADFSDAVDLNCSLMLQQGSSNPESDHILYYSFIDSEDVPKLEDGKKFYYRICRSLAQTWGWDDPRIYGIYEPYQAYAAMDSIACHTYQYSLFSHTADYPSIRPFDVKQKGDSAVEIRIVMEPETDAAGMPIRYGWDPSSHLFLTRRNLTSGEYWEVDLLKQEDVIISYCNSYSRETPRLLTVKCVDRNVMPCSSYVYGVRIDTAGCRLQPRKEAVLRDTCTTAFHIGDRPTTIRNFTASQGEFKDHVYMKWESRVQAVDSFVICCRIDENAEWVRVGSTTDQLYFIDDHAAPGYHYQYRIQGFYTCDGQVRSLEAEPVATGWLDPFGSISGSVTMPNGTGIADVTVEIYDGDNLVATTTTDASGSFLVDNIEYGAGTTFTIRPLGTDEIQYISVHSHDATVAATLSSANPTMQGCNFTTPNYRTITGRVLFYKTSVPVADVEFCMQVEDQQHPMQKLITPEGDAIRTDNNGYFTLQVPGNIRTLRAMKKGHEFLLDGYLESTTGNRELYLNEDLNEVRFYDTTKALLMGRIAGGAVQAAKKLGKDLSTNNIGDSITLVLELEGDRISQLVNDPTDLSLTSVDATYQHAPTVGVHATSVRTTRKQVTIRPDELSGEFRAELLPVRYKLVQLYAKGYSTLLNSDQGLPVIDLTGAAGDTAEYVYTYHSAPEISYTQIQLGVETPYYGEETFYITGYTEDDAYLKAARVVGDSVRYAFGYPVFAQDDYRMKVSVYEPYYYNGNRQTSLVDKVPVQGEVTVVNGFTPVPTTTRFNLNALGQGQFGFTADNITFTVTGEQALRTMDISVEIDGAVTAATPLQAYVIGTTTIPGEVATAVGSYPVLLDIIRDPYGAGSSASVGQGTSYAASENYSRSNKAGISAQIKYSRANTISNSIGVLGNGIVTKVVETTLSNLLPTLTINVVNTYTHKESFTHTYSTNNSISTSSDAKHVGAAGDVYVGMVKQAMLLRTRSIEVLDSASYALKQPAFRAGESRLITQGSDADGHPFYLAVMETHVPIIADSGEFIYPQKYLTETLLPDLKRKRNNLLMVTDDFEATKAQLETMAEQNDTVFYLSKVGLNHQDFGKEGSYEGLYKGNKAPTDMVSMYNLQIARWESFIKQNEDVKLAAIAGRLTKLGSYDTADGAVTSHSATSNSAYSHFGKWNWSTDAISLSNVNADMGKIHGNEGKQGVYEHENTTYTEKRPNQEDTTKTSTNDKISVFGWSLSINITPYLGFPSISTDRNISESLSRTASFTISTPDFERNVQSVYVKQELGDTDWINNDGFDHFEDTSTPGDVYGEVTEDSQVDTNKLGKPTHYVFIQEGGATACPWEGADMSYTYPGVALGTATQRLEKTSLEIDTHVRTGVPADEAAIFTLTIANESEVQTGKLAEYTLWVDDGTNPNGLKFYMDGQPISSGRGFVMGANSVLTKVIEVRRGQGYDFEDVRVVLSSNCHKDNRSEVKLSVHYVPVASPVQILQPTQSWVLNTLSPRDERGYYIPVSIGGFDINYDRFDHVELQYKLSTEGNDKWINLCSYYVNDSLFQAASGEREKIGSTGKIDGIRFYGERDPMEQRYDLRAVSYSRYGEGFITRASEVVRGIKDTRAPQQFGHATPTDGILTFEDDIRITFSEDIAGQYLDKDNNFQVLGSTNNTSLLTSTSLAFTGAEEAAVSVSTRSFKKSDFTIDLMAQTASATATGELFSFYNAQQQRSSIQFGIRLDDQQRQVLYAQLGYIYYESEPLPQTLQTFRRLMLCYFVENDSVTFFEGTTALRQAKREERQLDAAPIYKGIFRFGRGFTGRLLESRVWIKRLNAPEMSETSNVELSGNEQGLIAYYPMNDGRGSSAKDLAHSNELQLNGATWVMPEGRSIHLSAERDDVSVKLDQNIMSMSGSSDYSMMLWWKADSQQEVENNTMVLFNSGGDEPGNRIIIGLRNGTLFANGGSLQLNSRYTTADLQWHHLCLTVSRSLNQVSLYEDEQLVAQTSADGWPGISGIPYLGSNHSRTLDPFNGRYVDDPAYAFHGNLDCFSLWRSALPLDFISQYSQNAPSGEEIALQAYLQLHRRKLNLSGIYETVPSIYNQVCKRDLQTGVISVEASQNADTLLRISDEQLADIWDARIYAPVKEASKLGKINYNFVTHENELIIELTQPEKAINKQRVFISLREVEDLNGNPIASTITVPVYVDLNRIRWNEYSHDLETPLGQEGNFSAEIINRCGSNKQFSISSEAWWLTSDVSMGQLLPKEQRRITFSVSSGLNPGSYTTLAYVTDENGLSEALLVSVDVLAEEPDWDVDRSGASTTASLMADVMVNNGSGYVYDLDTRDIVAAFVDNQCIGKANITLNEGQSKVYMTMYGDPACRGRQISFRLWRASTGEISPLRDADTPDRIFTYSPDACFDCTGNLVLQTIALDNIQMVELNAGWTWTSYYLGFDSALSVNTTILNSSIFSAADIIKTTANNGMSTSFDGAKWLIDKNDPTKIFALDHHNVYQIYCAKGGKIEVIGNQLEGDQDLITVGGNRWCQLPYLRTGVQSVESALLNYVNTGGKKGDIVKSYDEFAVLNAEGHWVGSLEYMRPGQGYYLYCKNGGRVQFKLNDNVSSANATAAPARVAEWPTAMPLLATAEGVEIREGDVLSAYQGDRCVGSIEVRTSDDLEGGRFYLMTHAAPGQSLTFRLFREGECVALGESTVMYAPEAHYGTFEEPYGIRFTSVNSGVQKLLIDGRVFVIREGSWYYIDGRKVEPLF